MRGFLRSSDSSNNGFHLVNWDEVGHPQQEDGLRIRHLCGMLEALTAKGLWMFAKEEDAM